MLSRQAIISRMLLFTDHVQLSVCLEEAKKAKKKNDCERETAANLAAEACLKNIEVYSIVGEA